jgi:hypothetical protein
MKLSVAALLLFKAHKRKNRVFTFSRNRHVHRRTLSEQERYLRQRRIPRISLMSPINSPWRQVLTSSNDQAMITLTGFTSDAFNYLLEKFAPVYDMYSPFVDEDGYIVKKMTNMGRPRTIRPEDCLGLLLAWTRTRGSLMVLQLIFGLTMSPLSKYLQFARRIVIKILKKEPLAKICLPSNNKIFEYQETIHSRHPALLDVWGTMDGLKVRIEASPDGIVQSRFYNGWKSDHYVTAVLCFAPDGTIPACFYNVPGCTHDSTVADWGRIYSKLSRIYDETGAKFVIDSAFCTSRFPFLIKSSQDYLTADDNLLTYEEQITDLAIKREATSMRQSSEWGMRGVQASFPRLKDTLPYEEYGERKVIMTSLLLLFNLRARLVGFNQIRTVYYPALAMDANLEFLPH